jgi:hypothetical protein
MGSKAGLQKQNQKKTADRRTRCMRLPADPQIDNGQWPMANVQWPMSVVIVHCSLFIGH